MNFTELANPATLKFHLDAGGCFIMISNKYSFKAVFSLFMEKFDSVSHFKKNPLIYGLFLLSIGVVGIGNFTDALGKTIAFTQNYFLPALQQGGRLSATLKSKPTKHHSEMVAGILPSCDLGQYKKLVISQYLAESPMKPESDKPIPPLQQTRNKTSAETEPPSSEKATSTDVTIARKRHPLLNRIRQRLSER